MTQEALKLALEWYDSGHEIREEYEAMIKTILAQPEQEQKLIGTVGDLFDDRVIAHRKLDRNLLVYIEEKNT